MSTATAIIEGAARRLGVAPEAQEMASFTQTRLLTELTNMLASMPSLGVGGQLAEASVTSGNQTVSEPTRYLLNLSQAVSITLPANPVDGFRVSIIDVGASFATYNVTVIRNGRLLGGSASNATLSTNGQSVTYFYRADLGDWTVEAALTSVGDSVPYPTDFDAALSSMLAIRCWTEMASSSDLSKVQDEATEGLSALQARYGQRRLAQVDSGLLRMPSQNYSRPNYRTRAGT